MILSTPLHPNSLYYGDCLDVMSQWDSEQVDLIYLDPPFNSKADYNQLFGTENGVPAQVRAFTDTWTWNEAAAERYERLERAVAHPAHKPIVGMYAILGESGMLAYLTYMAERLAECRRLLKPHGSIYLHCDPVASHYLKILMDSIFGGGGGYRNEIVWCYKSRPQPKSTFGKKHDTILFYGLDDSAGFNWKAVARPLAEATIKKYRLRDSDGRRYRLQGRGISGSPIRSQKDVQQRWERERPDLVVRDYLDQKQGTTQEDWWVDIPILNQSAHERLGYPTQKPVALLERIIKASSNEGDLVLDPFCGCGTTIDAARHLNRNWIGIDISPFATRLVRNKRLKDPSIPIYGIPTDMEGARLLLRKNAFDFEAWIVTSIDGLAANEIQVGDRGIDGRGRMYAVPDGETGMVLAQVKGGGYTASALRDFQGTMARENASAGIFVTLDRVETRTARAAAQAMGTYQIGASNYPRLQFWSAAEYMQGVPPRLPTMADPYTGKAVQADLLEGA